MNRLRVPEASDKCPTSFSRCDSPPDKPPPPPPPPFAPQVFNG